MTEKPIYKTVLRAVGIGTLALLCARLLLRNLGPVLSFDPQFSAIFSQIATAKMTSPVLLLGALALSAEYGIQYLRGRKHRILATILGIIGFLALFTLSLLLTRVNGIRFVDVLVSLIDVLQKGGL